MQPSNPVPIRQESRVSSSFGRFRVIFVERIGSHNCELLRGPTEFGVISPQNFDHMDSATVAGILATFDPINWLARSSFEAKSLDR